MVTWQQFNKESIREDCSFSLWEWFFGIAELTRKHLADQWAEGLVAGFLSKERARERLLASAPGTFLIRFSESELGALTVAYSAIGPEGGSTVCRIEHSLEGEGAVG